MKKLILFAAIAASTLFASCKKDRVCSCTYTSSSGATITGEVTYVKASKRDARANCLSRKEVYPGGATETYDCKLK